MLDRSDYMGPAHYGLAIVGAILGAYAGGEIAKSVIRNARDKAPERQTTIDRIVEEHPTLTNAVAIVGTAKLTSDVCGVAGFLASLYVAAKAGNESVSAQNQSDEDIAYLLATRASTQDHFAEDDNAFLSKTRSS